MDNYVGLQYRLFSDFAAGCDRAKSRSLQEVLDSGRKMDNYDESDVPVIEVQQIGQFQCPLCQLPMQGHMDPDPEINTYLVKCINPDCALGFKEFEPPTVLLRVRVLPNQAKKVPPLVLTSPNGYTSPPNGYTLPRYDPLSDWPVRD